jgi:GNAT superfamily N-acetyltransferase
MLELRVVPGEELPARQQLALDRAAARRLRTRFEDPERAAAVAEGVLERNAPDLRHYDVRENGATVGWMLWRHKSDESDVSDLVLDEPARASELLPALIETARADGARFLGVTGVPGEPDRDPLVALDVFVPRATNLALPLDGHIGDPGGLELRPMTQEAFDAYLEGSTEQYIGELAAAGMSQESARRQGEQQMAELVPAGLESPGQSFFTAWVDDLPVGTLWLSTEDPLAFVYDIAVDESQRRKGYGEAMMNAGARWCRDLGHPALGLNVFAHNPNARALYDKLGYRVTADYRSIDLDDAG